MRRYKSVGSKYSGIGDDLVTCNVCGGSGKVKCNDGYDNERHPNICNCVNGGMYSTGINGKVKCSECRGYGKRWVPYSTEINDPNFRRKH